MCIIWLSRTTLYAQKGHVWRKTSVSMKRLLRGHVGEDQTEIGQSFPPNRNLTKWLFKSNNSEWSFFYPQKYQIHTHTRTHTHLWEDKDKQKWNNVSASWHLHMHYTRVNIVTHGTLRLPKVTVPHGMLQRNKTVGKLHLDLEIHSCPSEEEYYNLNIHSDRY